jgi:hypothetical protein
VSSHSEHSSSPPLGPDGRKVAAIRLSTGHLAIVREAGIRSDFQNHTVHRVLFFASEKDLLAGDFLHEHDFETQWSGPHPDPGSRMLRILERHCQAADQHQLPNPVYWKGYGYCSGVDIGGTPDTHGILAHPSMVRFQPAGWP